MHPHLSKQSPPITPPIDNTHHFQRHIKKYLEQVEQSNNIDPAALTFIHELRRIENFVKLVEGTSPEIRLLDAPPAMKPITNMVRLERFFQLRVFDVSILSPFNGKVAFNDRVQMFLDVVQQHHNSLEQALATEGKRFGHAGDIAKINAVIQDLRERVQSSPFRRRLARTKEQSKRNLLGMQALVNGLFERYARLLVVRVDLTYLKVVHENNHRVLTQDPSMDVQMALKHRDALLNNRRHKPAIFEHCVGYITQLEQGIQGGCHLHTFFFFDGSKVRSDFHYGNLIGLYWRDDITQGKGLFHSCHAKSGTNKVMGVGLIEYDDQEKRDALMNDALSYLVKDEQVVMVKPLKRIATLTHSNLPRDTPKRGPKRKERRASADHVEC